MDNILKIALDSVRKQFSIVRESSFYAKVSMESFLTKVQAEEGGFIMFSSPVKLPTRHFWEGTGEVAVCAIRVRQDGVEFFVQPALEQPATNEAPLEHSEYWVRPESMLAGWEYAILDAIETVLDEQQDNA